VDSIRVRQIEPYIRELAPYFEERVILFGSLLAVILVLMILIIVFQILLLKMGWVKRDGFLGGLLKFSPTILGTILLIPILFVQSQVTYITFYIRPNIIATYPASGETMQNAEPNYVIEFDLPVDTSNLEFNVSPEIEGEWKMERIYDNYELSRRAVFQPKTSVTPGQPIVLYITGMRSWRSNGKLHEQAVEFSSPPVPNIEKVSIEDGAVNFKLSDDITVEYDSNLGDFVEFKYSISPNIEFEINKTDENIHKIEFLRDLEQDQVYEFKGYRETRVYDLNDNSDIERSDTEEVLSISFTTVSAPLLDSYSPKGSGINPSDPVKAVFDQEMNHEEVEKYFSITPEVSGTISWEDTKTFVFTPDQQFERGQRYSVMFMKGIQSEYTGRTEQDITFSFETAGDTVVTSFTPLNGSTGIERSVTIAVTFNQAVDHNSAQSKFTLTPAANGSFSWEGNTLRFTTSELAYFTNYTINIASGVKSIYGIDSKDSYSSIFGTRSNVVTLDFPWYQQQENFTCNVAATRMVLAYYGTNVSETYIKSGLGTGTNPNQNWVPGYGVHVGPVANFISQYRTAEIKTGWNIVDLAHEIEAGHPVILWWYNRYSQPAGPFTLPSGVTGYNGMHSEVVYGYRGDADNPTAFLVRDPWRGHLEYNASFFKSNWAYMNYTALVIK
jgi:uncharacterized protein YvpB